MFLNMLFIRSFIDHIDSNSAQGNHCNDSSGCIWYLLVESRLHMGLKDSTKWDHRHCQGCEYMKRAQEPGGARNRFVGTGSTHAPPHSWRLPHPGKQLSHFYKQC